MKRNYFFITFIAFFLLPAATLFAQFSELDNYVSRIWTSTDGLPGNSISDILQSDDGYIYLGTYESLVRFDGYEFESINKYTNKNYSFVSARSIFQDSTGTLWVGSNDEGVQKIDDGKTERYSTDNGLPNNSIRAFAEDKNHNLWIGTASGIVYLTPQGTFVTPRILENESSEYVLVSQLYKDTADKIWLATSANHGLYVYTNDAFQRFTLLDSLGNYTVSCIAQDLAGDFLIGLSEKGIVKYSNGKVSLLETGTILDSTPTYSIVTDRFGTIWFGTQKGIVIFKDGNYTTYEGNKSIMNCTINKLFEDREGNMWVTTDSEGLGKISLGKFRMTVLGTGVNAICEDRQGNVWVGTDEGLLCYNDEQIRIENELTEFCQVTRVRHIALTPENDLLVNCYTAPAQVKYSNGKIYSWTTDDGLTGNKTRVSLETKKGDLWSGTTTGLSLIKADGSIKNYSANEGFDNEYIMCLFEDAEGQIWVGTDGGGIYVIDSGRVKHFGRDDGLTSDVIIRIVRDEQHDLYWLVTSNSIQYYKNGIVKEVTTFPFNKMRASQGGENKPTGMADSGARG
jgi:ligand-binding sensor domain-containing protein